jgi:hypothetical protein
MISCFSSVTTRRTEAGGAPPGRDSRLGSLSVGGPSVDDGGALGYTSTPSPPRHPGRFVNLQQPKRIVFGAGALLQAAEIADLGIRRVLLVTGPPIAPLTRPLVEALEKRGVAVTVFSGADSEPSITLFETVLEVVRSARPEAF